MVSKKRFQVSLPLLTFNHRRLQERIENTAFFTSGTYRRQVESEATPATDQLC